MLHMKTTADTQGLALYLDFQSYGQEILTPYWYSDSATPPNSTARTKLGEKAAAAISKVHDKQYGVQAANAGALGLGVESGTGLDYAVEVAKAKHAFVLKPRDQGLYGYLLPPPQIKAVGEEMLEGVKAIIADL